MTSPSSLMRIVLAGAWYRPTGTEFALVRYTHSGSLDKTFGLDGRVHAGLNVIAFALAIQSDGKIVAAGSTDGPPYSFVLMRFRPGGSLDPTFGRAGVVATRFGSAEAFAHDLVVSRTERFSRWVKRGISKAITSLPFATRPMDLSTHPSGRRNCPNQFRPMRLRRCSGRGPRTGREDRGSRDLWMVMRPR